MSFEHRVRVRYSETDQMGVVHHANYLLYMEEARTSWMRVLGCPYNELEATGISLPVRKMNLRYLAPARYEDELIVSVEIASMRGASVRFAYNLRRVADDQRIAKGEIELACVDMSKSPPQPRLLPDEVRRCFLDQN